MKFTVKNIVYIGLLTSLTIVATFIGFTIPLYGSNGALMHFGTAVSVVSVLVFGKKTGTISGTLGMTLFDIIGGWASWAPGTFFSRLGLGYILGKFSYDKNDKLRNTSYQMIGLFIGGLWMCFIYYVWEVILYHQPIVALGSIPANVIQIASGFLIGIPIAKVLNKSLKIDRF
ncbi:ECF transporter S component [Mycoplasma sp. P36-A1]|uniref:ECF transporter S component n=1 Tax=Mycoplasma sp. P36-A1 TaxID=3252900 RepID=UPI003C2B92B3